MYPTIDKVKTGKLLGSLMQAYGLSPKDICNYLSLSCVQTVYRWLEGVNVPSLDNLYALSRLFRMHMDDLVVGNHGISGNIPIWKNGLLYWRGIRRIEKEYFREF